jgi:GntR family transcriptional regulator, carbon starvation induced regulator
MNFIPSTLNSGFIFPDAPSAKGEQDESTRAEHATQVLYHAIVVGELEPNERLKLDSLKKRYKIGSSPLREALIRLSSAGMVVLEGYKGFKVAPASIAELEDIGTTRSRLSVWALGESIRLGGEEWETRVVAAYHRLDRLAPRALVDPSAMHEEWELRNRQFHLALESACNSPWLLNLSEIIFIQSQRYRRWFSGPDPGIASAHAEHKQIMEAALARDTENACRTLSIHIIGNLKHVIGVMADDGSKKSRSTRTKAAGMSKASQKRRQRQS